MSNFPEQFYRDARDDLQPARRLSLQSCKEKIYNNDGNAPLLELIRSLKPGQALDCGCGAGDNARILSSWGWRVTGITLSEGERRVSADCCEQVIIHDLQQGLPVLERTYALAVLSHVLEHLAYPGVLLEGLKNVLTPDGIVAVALPNVLSIRQRINFVFGRFEYEPTGVMDETHLRFYTFKSGAQLLTTYGYSIHHASASGSVPMRGLRRLLSASLARRIDRVACSWMPSLCGIQSIYLATPH